MIPPAPDPDSMTRHEQMLRDLTDHIPMLVAIADSQQRYRYCNRAYQLTFNVMPEQIVGKTAVEFLGEEGYAAVRPHIEKVLQGETTRFERAMWAKGEQRYVEGRYVPQIDADGSVTGFYVMVWDITDRKRAEQSVQDANQRLEQSVSDLELAHRNISVLSEIGRQITASLDREAVMAAIFAHVNELMDASIFGISLYRPERRLLECPFAIAGGKRYAPFTRSMDEPNQLAVWCVTHRQEVFINDLDTEYSGYIDDLDRALMVRAALKLEDGTVPARPSSMIYVPMLLKDRVLGVISVQSHSRHAYERVHLDMLKTLAAYAAVALDNADAYRQLQETQQQMVLQEKMASLGTLTAGVAHEINNPANFAHVGAQALTENLERFRHFLLTLAGDDAAPEIRDSLNQHIDSLQKQTATINEGTHRIRNLVRDLRTFSRLDEAERKSVPIADSLLATVHLVETQYSHVAEIRCALAANPVLECWPAQLNQVFMNLIVNACQAIQAKQRASGDATRGTLSIRSRIEDANLLIEFEDTGCGIPESVIDRVFEPFFTTKPVGEGTGLGLSVSFGIVDKHGGSLRVRSKLGDGTTFELRLPLTVTDPSPCPGPDVVV